MAKPHRWAGAGQPLGTTDRARIGIITPTNHAPVLTGTHRNEPGTTVRSTRHWRNPMAATAARADGTRSPTAKAVGTIPPDASTEPPIPTNHANPAPDAVATTQLRRDSAVQYLLRT